MKYEEAVCREINGDAYWVSSLAEIEEEVEIGLNTRIWEYAKIREGARIGADCTLGRGVFVDHGVIIGDRCKLQNNAQIYFPAVMNDGSFVGPGAILANDVYPRAISPDGRLKREADWLASGVTVGLGATVGAAAIVRGDVEIGQWAMVGAGAVVIADVPPFAMVVGVPARQVAWVGRSGEPLERLDDGVLVDHATGDRFVESQSGLVDEA